MGFMRTSATFLSRCFVYVCACVRVCCYSFFFCWIHLLYFGDLHLTIDGRSPDTWNFHTFHSILCAQRFSRLLLLFRFVILGRSLFVTIFFLFECRQFLHISIPLVVLFKPGFCCCCFYLQAFHCFLWLCSGLIPPFLQYSLKLLVTSVVCYFRLFATLVFLSKFYVRFHTSLFQCPKFFLKYLRLNEKKNGLKLAMSDEKLAKYIDCTCQMFVYLKVCNELYTHVFHAHGKIHWICTTREHFSLLQYLRNFAATKTTWKYLATKFDINMEIFFTALRWSCIKTLLLSIKINKQFRFISCNLHLAKERKKKNGRIH